MQPLRIPLGIQLEAGREHHAHGCTSVCKCMPVTQSCSDMGRLTRGFVCVLWWWWGDRRGMRDSEEQVNYDICKSAQQDEAFYGNVVKKDQDHSRG